MAAWGLRTLGGTRDNGFWDRFPNYDCLSKPWHNLQETVGVDPLTSYRGRYTLYEPKEQHKARKHGPRSVPAFRSICPCGGPEAQNVGSKSGFQQHWRLYTWQAHRKRKTPRPHPHESPGSPPQASLALASAMRVPRRAGQVSGSIVHVCASTQTYTCPAALHASQTCSPHELTCARIARLDLHTAVVVGRCGPCLRSVWRGPLCVELIVLHESAF